jgi:two-component system, NarL family, response regulator LiaR
LKGIIAAMESSKTIRVVLIDDHRHIHEAVTLILTAAEDIELVGQGSNGEDALQLCEQLRPDLILMDVVMPYMNGIEATRQIRERYPAVKILVLSSFQDDESVRVMLESGAAGYVLKSTLNADLLNAIRAIHANNLVFSSEIAATLLRAAQQITTPNTFDLTQRELEVLRYMAEGLNNNEIAAKLVISPSTVKFHLNNILQKMRVSTRAEAIVLATKNQLI